MPANPLSEMKSKTIPVVSWERGFHTLQCPENLIPRPITLHEGIPNASLAFPSPNGMRF
jgi:hypothetical protein